MAPPTGREERWGIVKRFPRGTKYAQHQRMGRTWNRLLGGNKAGETKKPLLGAERPAWHKDRAGHGAAHWAGIKRGKQKSPSSGQKGPLGIRTGPDTARLLGGRKDGA